MNCHEILKLLSALNDAKNILNYIHEYDDCDIIELLEIKYEKLYVQLHKN